MLATQSSIPPKVTLQAPTHDNLPSFKKINSLLLPIAYPPSFYSDILEDEQVGQLTRLAFWNSECVGGVRCRLEETIEDSNIKDNSCAALNNSSESTKHSKTTRKIYIMTLAVLAPYRHLAIGTLLLKYIQETAKTAAINASQLYAHVWVANTEAMEFYNKRGFDTTTGPVIERYYRRLKPDAARIVFKAVE